MCTIRRENEGPTFGIPLRLLCERSGVEVPVILGDILRWLAAHALAQPDVFAQAPKSAATSQLKSAIDIGASLAELVEGTHPAVVGSLLKRWLEELPNPLLNWDQQVELLSACKDEGCIEARIASLNDAVALVDPLSLGTLKPLLLFLQQYCFRQRRFDQQLLQVAVAFAPILFPAALAAGPAELRLAEETVATLVSNALHVFNPMLAANVPVVTPQALCEAAAEIMDANQHTQQQHRSRAAEALSPAHHWPQGLYPPGAEPASFPVDHQPQPSEQQVEGPYEPYFQDAPFLASLDVMVDSCVVTALFASDDAADHANWGLDDDCGSVASSCSIRLSTGGGASSGGASTCSTTSLTLAPENLHAHNGAQSTPNHSSKHHTSSACGSQQAQPEAPYSPRAVLVTPLKPPEDEHVVPPARTGVSTCGVSGVKSRAGTVVPPVKAAPVPACATLAEIAQREVSEGSVFCIISAQPGGTMPSISPAVVTPAGGGSATQIKPYGNGQHQRHDPLPALDIPAMQAAMLSLHADAHMRRPTEGGAIAMAQQLGQAEPRQRRMTMGGGEVPDAAAAMVQIVQGHTRPQQQSCMSAPSHTTVPIAGTPQLQRQQQQTLRYRPGSGPGSSPTSGSGNSSPQSSASQLPPAAASPVAPHSGGCIAELGVAGHLRVSLTAALTLVVRELTTPEAMAHRTSLRTLSVQVMQSEKERLKRQLKDVAAAYEALAGRPLTPALKEPLRPVYVRYHKIKALLNSGRAAPYKESQVSASTGRASQKPASLTASRPAVVA